MVRGEYLDGRSTRIRQVQVMLEGDQLSWRGDGVQGAALLVQVNVSARMTGVPFTLRLPHGAQLQIDYDDMPADWFRGRNRIESLVDWLERKRWAALASVLAIGLGLIGWLEYGMPWMADRVAARMPQRMDVAMGQQTLVLMRGRMLLPSQVPAERQAHLQALFDRFSRNVAGLPAVHLAIYDSPSIGANAFALPDGTVVFTDAILKALPDDRSFLAVAAHELGHLAHHHQMREVMRHVGSTLMISLAFGDVTSLSGVSAALPTFLLNNHYSRAFEADADDFAFKTLAQQSVDPIAFADAMHALEQAHPGEAGGGEVRYMSNHPLTEERIEKAQAASHQFQLGRH
ncbi:M48 family metallopeptidase [Dyella choica]|uniref:M48 family metallopeptidase n=1 Tax=Dyella choica TaxID=1927959 RepID=A0A3S0PG21_9GAMM|nr:M48 family metallopeptidase [Dyella choica]RUL71013.1 M48 family metallopeptidase [Dyella choica]